MERRAGALRVPVAVAFSPSVVLLPLLLLLVAGTAEGRPEEGSAAANAASSPPPVATATTSVKPGDLGDKKFGDDCSESNECDVEGGFCDSDKGVCQCLPGFSVTNHIDKCGKKASVNESCFFHEQCESENEQTECRDGRCICRFEKFPLFNSDGTVTCVAIKEERPSLQTVNPAMIGVLVGLALMFVILCVVLRLFSKARWRENRTIFNTPNPRLMNVSLLRDSKLLHGAGERRTSRGSIRAPSRQPSMASLRPQSPAAASLAGGEGSRRGSKTSNGSATSPKSPNSPIAPPQTSAAGGGSQSGASSGPNTSGNVVVEVRDPKV